MSESRITHYEVLSLKVDATSDEVKRNYRELLLLLHPDKHKTTVPTNPDLKVRKNVSINQIQEAYRVLSDEKLRTRYNKELNESNKRAGFHNFGDGLDEYNLDDFEFDEDKCAYSMVCPRCRASGGFHLTEDALDDYVQDGPTDSENNEYQVLTQCTACSLWLKINFFIADSDEAE
ncbi:hypothetical protein RNJ44_01571 [Nakaseomyces bracarensis]|uniref:Diphthamide biosynthesis protein 4 n=1 Tax=Nakaseomyces bracarensis TaxID=273131 RepID=A0ABR4NQ57_9SACH